jgi:hypothetical protein
MFNCKEVTQVVSKSLDQAVPFHHQVFLRIHFLMCKYCSRFSKQLLVIRETSRFQEIHPDDLDPSVTLPPAACKRIKKSLDQHTGHYR